VSDKLSEPFRFQEGNMPRKKITATQAARRTHSTHNYICQLARVGKLRGRKRDGLWEIDADSVEALIAERRKRREKSGSSRQFAEVEVSTSVEQVIES
jgi:hypothetical protein